MKIGFIGLGNMARAIIGGIIEPSSAELLRKVTSNRVKLSVPIFLLLQQRVQRRILKSRFAWRMPW